MREWKAEYARRNYSSPAPPEDTSTHQEERACDASPPLSAASPDASPPSPATSPPRNENAVLAEENCTLKLKLKVALTVANSCTLLLKNERAETSEKIRKLDWALLLERSAHKRLKENPLGHQLGPTREEVQERLAKERERAARWEHKRQAAIEQDLRRKLAEKIERERDPERRAEEEAAAERAKSKGTALATALAVARRRSGLTDF